MTRKQSRRKYRPGMHPLDAITACQPFPQAEVTRILLRVHDAFSQLQGGCNDPEIFDRMAAVVNVGMIRSESIGQAGVDVFQRAQAALMECDGIAQRHGKYGFTGQGLEVMREAISLYEDLLRASTPRQMHDCQMECMKRLRAGEYLKAKEQA
jgi:hypothetical protein